METFEVGFGKPRPRAAHRDGDSINYRLDVVAANPADVVGSVGGWLCDRVRAGWDVHVLLPQRCDSRPLQILGMRVAELDWQILSTSTDCAARGLAVSADIFAADARIRQEVITALDRLMTEVTLWHDDWPLAVGHRTTTVQHVLSGAARAFKQHALAAAGIPGTAGPTETLRSDMKASLPVDSELIPVGCQRRGRLITVEPGQRTITLLASAGGNTSASATTWATSTSAVPQAFSNEIS